MKTFLNLARSLGLTPPLHGLEELLEQVANGTLGVDDAAEEIRSLALQPHFPPWAGRFLIAVGLMFALIGVAFGINSLRFSFGTQETPGVVVQMEGEESEAPVIEYTVNGRLLTFHSRLYSEPPAYAVGDKVTMIYKRENPQDAQINSFRDRWMFPLGFTWAGLIAASMGYFLPLFMRQITSH